LGLGLGGGVWSQASFWCLFFLPFAPCQPSEFRPDFRDSVARNYLEEGQVKRAMGLFNRVGQQAGNKR
jgi:hypothetical protein